MKVRQPYSANGWTSVKAALRTMLVLNLGLAATNTAIAGFDDGVEALTRRDYAMALEEFRSLADGGHAGGRYYLGRLYLMGEGVSADYKQAAILFREAATQGHANAQFYLGVLHYMGEGVPKDYAEAMKWYGRAAAQGDPIAQYHLGVMYAGGEGVPPDRVQALTWFNLAAASGSERAAQFREIIMPMMTAADIAAADNRARAWKPVSGKQRQKR